MLVQIHIPHRRMSKNYLRTHHRVLIGTQSMLAVTLLTLTAVRFGSLAFADPGGGGDMPQFGASAPSTGLNDVGTQEGNGNVDGGLALFRANKDNTRNRWIWTQEAGWQLAIDEETYEKGWAWYWKDGQWSWERLNTDAPGNLKSAAPAVSSSASSSATSIASLDEAGCFDDLGAWVTDRTKCADDQNTKRLEAIADNKEVLEVLPVDIREVLEIAAPMTPSQEVQVKAALIERFEGPAVVAETEEVIQHTATDVVRKLSILKASDALTDKEREYFVSKIVEAQELLTSDEKMASMDIADSSAEKLAELVVEVQTYVKDHSISVSVANAPTAPSIFASSERIFAALPSAFDTLDASDFSTSNLRAMYASTSMLANEVSVRCTTQNKDCSRVSDVVHQLENIVSTLNEMLNASGNGALKDQVRASFDEALRH